MPSRYIQSSNKSSCETCNRDHGFCIYCQRQFMSNGRLHRHIQTIHKDTIRANNCKEVGK